MKTIVVGVDGSERSDEALRWAVEEARVHGAELRVVYAYEYTAAWSLYSYPAEGVVAPDLAQGPAVLPPEESAPIEQEARARAEGMLRETVARVDTTGVDVRALAVEDRRPARALVEQSKQADLIVVSSRGRGGFGGLLLGSVSQKVALHAACPVVIVRGPQVSMDDE